MTRSEGLVAPYRPGSDGQPRPYLILALIGPDSGHEISISGLVDTGADSSVLPLDYAELLGYSDTDLEPVDVSQVEGKASAWAAKRPCLATVDGIPDLKFEMKPLFVASLQALWGRADLMMSFTISVSERDQALALQPSM